jgi:hypothetical protein
VGSYETFFKFGLHKLNNIEKYLPAHQFFNDTVPGIAIV